MAESPPIAAGTTNHVASHDSVREQATYRFGFGSALLTAAVTVVTFVLALTALPNDVPYPFTSDEIAGQ